MRRVLVCGGRDFDDYALLNTKMWEVAEKCGMPIEIVHGAAKGADKVAAKWGGSNYGAGIKVNAFPAKWNNIEGVNPKYIGENSYGKYNKLAGFERNQRMLDYLLEQDNSIVVAFRDGASKGTKDMISKSRSAGLKVIVVHYGDQEELFNE